MTTPHIFRSAHDAGIEWEELPSLSNVVLRRNVPQGSYAIASQFVDEARARMAEDSFGGPVWVETKPSELDPLQPSLPLADTRIEGLAAREIVEPDLFRHFFGRAR